MPRDISFIFFWGGGDDSTKIGSYIPAPVVPPALLEDRTLGDWVTVRSRPLTVSSMVEDFGSMMPSSLLEGMLCEKSRKASARGQKHSIVRNTETPLFSLSAVT